MSVTHNFWILPTGFNPTAQRIIKERYDMWGIVPLQGRHWEDATRIRMFLTDFCIRKRRQAIHVNNRMMLDALSKLQDVRTLRNGWLPAWGIPMQDMAVIPSPEIPRLMLAIMVQPPSAAWRRLYELCREAFAKDDYILHESVLQSEAEEHISEKNFKARRIPAGNPESRV